MLRGLRCTRDGPMCVWPHTRAGAACAMHLCKAGFRVDVVERRAHPGSVAADKRRTFLIGLGALGGLQLAPHQLTAAAATAACMRLASCVCVGESAPTHRT
jgi:2-polyprenyl-6-methoxyphenol hydroxylase-like FAD-dependent oxidoreductase